MKSPKDPPPSIRETAISKHQRERFFGVCCVPQKKTALDAIGGWSL
jgi:hypothetical protein